jgi:uncharacterized protein YecA (UPF0149 family)
MKTIFTLALALFLGVANAQSKKETVPSPVKEKFATMYPNATKVSWEKEGDYYEAEFDNNKVETSVVFDATGKHIETEIEIAVSELPQAARDYVAQNMAGKKIKEAAKITAADGTVTYEAEVDEADYIFDANGNFVKKIVEAADDKDDDDKKEGDKKEGK